MHKLWDKVDDFGKLALLTDTLPPAELGYLQEQVTKLRKKLPTVIKAHDLTSILSIPTLFEDLLAETLRRLGYDVRSCLVHGQLVANVQRSGPPRFWKLFSYVFSHRIRSRIFEPALNEMIEDYLLARQDYRTQWARRWLNFCFTFRMMLTVLECFRAVIADSAFRSLARLLPDTLRRWWMLQ
jgi:hypothetical protein